MRTKLILQEEKFKDLGFEYIDMKSNDNRDNFWKLDLSNEESNENTKIIMFCDSFFDFTMEIENTDCVVNLNLNFQSENEIVTFKDVFKRPFNHAFAGLIDICNE